MKRQASNVKRKRQATNDKRQTTNDKRQMSSVERCTSRPPYHLQATPRFYLAAFFSTATREWPGDGAWNASGIRNVCMTSLTYLVAMAIEQLHGYMQRRFTDHAGM